MIRIAKKKRLEGLKSFLENSEIFLVNLNQAEKC